MIEILNSNLKKIDILRKYTFSQFSECFRDIGTFKINARLEEENLYLLDTSQQYYMLFNDKYLCKLEKVSRSSDNENNRTVTLEGRMASLILTKRVIAGTINYSGTTAGFVKALIDSEILADTSSNRYVNINVVYDDETYLASVCSNITKQTTGGYLWDDIQEALETDKLGIYFYPNIQTAFIPKGKDYETNIDSWNLTISAGKDRSKGNSDGNVPVIFSQSLSNIASTEYERNVKEYCNVAYVAGEGEAEERKWYEIYNSDSGASEKVGFERSELWVDARDIQSEDTDGNTITDAEYEELINERANEKFADAAVEESYTATITEANNQYTYGVDYNLGDFVSVVDNELGITIKVQVTEVTRSVQNNREIVDIAFTYGVINRDPIDQINNLDGETEKNTNNITYLENKVISVESDLSKLKPTTLYEATPDGSLSKTVTLSESALNFEYIEIYTCSDFGHNASSTEKTSYAKAYIGHRTTMTNFMMSTVNVDWNSNFYIDFWQLKFTSNTTIQGDAWRMMSSSSSIDNLWGNTYGGIYRVVGWKHEG